MPVLVRSAANVIAGLLLMTVSAQRTWALRFEAFGPAGEHFGRSSDWPKGVEVVLRHPSRVYWTGNGLDQSFYDGDIETVNELLDGFSQVDLKSHPVVLRTGRPSARSFQGKLTPYVAMFELPNRRYLDHVNQYAATGLYSSNLRLIVHIDDTLVDFLDALRIPSNVSLQTSSHRIQDALAHADSDNRLLRGRAISILGEAGNASQEVLNAIRRAAEADDDYIRSEAEKALKRIEEANNAAAKQLRAAVNAFVAKHPQRRRVFGPEELLKKLRQVDADYAQGFTATGTMVPPSNSRWAKVVAWTLTMGNDRLVLRQRALENAQHPPSEGRIENTIFVSPDRMATIHQSRLWVDGKLIESKPHTSFEPVGSTYDLLIGRVLWPIGRGFTRRIDRITRVEAQADGTLAVNAESDKTLGLRWEMKIDPNADYLVRSAKAFRRRGSTLCIVDNAGGVLFADGRATGHTARWAEGALAQPVSIAVHSVSAKMDAELIRETEARLQ